MNSTKPTAASCTTRTRHITCGSLFTRDAFTYASFWTLLWLLAMMFLLMQIPLRGMGRHVRAPSCGLVSALETCLSMNVPGIKGLHYQSFFYFSSILETAKAYAASRSVTPFVSAKSATSRYASCIVSASRSRTSARVHCSPALF